MHNSKPNEALHDRVDFTRIRYAQCWEDADILVKAAKLNSNSRCLSVASAGDNTLALLTREPAELVALDINPAQLACLALRVAAYKTLNHTELLGFIGARPCADRITLYQRCRKLLSERDRKFWDARAIDISRGLGAAGRFEAYLTLFRRFLLPLIQNPSVVASLFNSRTQSERQRFYTKNWDNWRWQLLFRLFCSRIFMGRVGRDPELFRYVQGSVSKHILDRTYHALTRLNPATNPYLHWILYGNHGEALPLALRAEHFDSIRDNLGRLHWQCASIEDYLIAHPNSQFDAFNLSDIFEYMSESDYAELLGRLVKIARPQARLIYWNMLAKRTRPQTLAPILKPLKALAARLHFQDQAFFYSRFVIEEVQS